MSTHLSKSRYLNGLQCPKLLWTQFNRRDLIPAPPPAQQHIFDTGHEVGDLAKQLWPTGVEIPMNHSDLAATATETAALMMRPAGQRVPIFEASFLIDGRYCRVDVLVPVADDPDRWDLIEVKSSTRVRDVNVNDVAFQQDTLTRAGVQLRRLGVMHVDSSYVRGDTLEVERLFHLDDVTERAAAVLPYVPRAVQQMQEVVAGADPDTPIGPRCNTPYTCPLLEQCWSVLPADNVTELYYVGRKAFGWLDEGIFRIAEAPDSRLTPQQRIQKRALLAGKAHVDPEALRRWLDELIYPVHHLDFETMNPAVPPFAGQRPYQRVPFQFSLHVQEAPGAAPRHVDFLATAAEDPRPALLQALHGLGDTGSILVWNLGFEKGVLEDLAERFPGESRWLTDLTERLVDLIVPFRHFWYHHPAQRGSCSLKAVLPAVTGLDYDRLAIADGNHAARAYVEAVFGDTPESLKPQIFKQLREYCQMDTLAMVEILRVLEREARSAGS